MHPAIAVVLLGAVNGAISWFVLGTRMTRVYAADDLKLRLQSFLVRLVITIHEELAYRFGVPFICMRYGLSHDAIRAISSIAFGLSHMTNGLVSDASQFAHVQSSIFAASLGMVLFDVESLGWCVAYHLLANMITIFVTTLAMQVMKTADLMVRASLRINRATSPDSFNPDTSLEHEIRDPVACRAHFIMSSQMLRADVTRMIQRYANRK